MSTVKPAAPILLYRHPISGHAHRVELFLSLLGLPATLIDVDLAAGTHKQPAFLAKNIFAQIPVIEDGNVTLSDSNAILVYLATKYGDESWLPRTPEGAAQVQRFLSIAAGDIAFGVAAARVANIFGAPFDHATVQARAHRLLAIFDQLLAQSPYLTGQRPSIADVACYSYLSHAPEAGIALDAYPQVLAWIARIEALPGFVPMCVTRVGLAA
ncbi:glutathione S-transferase family protein [Undibacterium arcticum]|uniref:Glutathione S-transferase family protein n=1 Tax=Undibacterium arcticum TaxID=1762892 RepID=A0ABV7EYU1_9BURK